MTDKVRGLIVVAACLWYSPVASFAAFQTGNDLLRECDVATEAANAVRLGNCFGYIDAITDTLLAGNSLNSFRACIPHGLERGQLKDIVVQFLRLNPSYRHSSGEGLVAGALSKAFPCR